MSRHVSSPVGTAGAYSALRSVPTPNSKEISRRKIFLRWYLKKLNSDLTRVTYWEYLDRIGQVHSSPMSELVLTIQIHARR